MSRVLARPMFKKKAPKQSARGVGITSMLEDDVPGYAEGGEVDNRKERERVARELFEKNKDEMDGYQTFSEAERPQLFRQPATMPMAPQPTPQQMQAMQMQQMAAAQQAGMLPRFSEGGPVNFAAPIAGPLEAPSAWAQARNNRQVQPMFARGSGDAVYAPQRDSTMGSPGMDNPEYAVPSKDNWFARLYREPSNIPTDAVNTDPMGGYTGGSLPPPPTSDQGSLGIPGAIPRALLGLPVFKDSPKPPTEAEIAQVEAAREDPRIKPKPKKTAEEDDDGTDEGGGGTKPPGSDKNTDMSAIKAEREAKQAALRQENIWLAMLQAGLAIAGGKSSNAITNIGQGGQAGLGAFITLEQQRRRDEDAAMRRDIAERELQLQTRRMNAQEPLIAAQAAYYRDRPGIEAAKLSMAEKKMLFLARSKAEDQVYAEMAKNPLYLADKNGKRDELRVQMEIKKRTQKNFLEDQMRPSGNGGGLGLDLPDTSGGE